MMEGGADLGLEERQGSIQGEAAPDPHQAQGNGRHQSGAANGHSKMSAKSPASNPRLKACRSNFTVPQPFSLTTEKRASKIQSPVVNGSTPSTTQKLATKKVESPATKSHGSSPAGATLRPSKAEFVFKSDERAQKRMEFYANLTEKSKAREAERNKIQANNQQQMAAEIKKLRKDQTFKATPMPKFYQEPAPVRIDVKKTPPTRPKSPRLGRRASGSGEAPKIIARRSSDEYEYEVSKIPAEDLKPATPPISSEPPRATTTNEERIIQMPVELEREGSEHSSSRKSDNSLIPKAALSEDEEFLVSTPEPVLPPPPSAAAAAAAEEKEEDHSEDHSPALESSRPGVESSGLIKGSQVLQLPVSSSLLDDDGEDVEVGGGSEYEEDDDEEEEDHEAAELEFPSPGEAGDDDHGDEEQENVRVYISEEFRLAAAANSTSSKAEAS